MNAARPGRSARAGSDDDVKIMAEDSGFARSLRQDLRNLASLQRDHVPTPRVDLWQ